MQTHCHGRRVLLLRAAEQSVEHCFFMQQLSMKQLSNLCTASSCSLSSLSEDPFFTLLHARSLLVWRTLGLVWWLSKVCCLNKAGVSATEGSMLQHWSWLALTRPCAAVRTLISRPGRQL